ncbi:MAG: Lipoprotein LpqB, GerMN domain protein [Anaerosolibacter sp.]|jgi:germination protein M|uniref:GerMN domain-containing protein n=1 Tax=Anaerosolibacter sp. TaxID=1872527 RepID=UPI00262B2F61|nr:GerMN domain-containing protein [Anaerosolibacter sp.]MDF2547088.1 Lipoprotein LpqB, GerMN domain protein [Anaerosolibacter sp.]
MKRIITIISLIMLVISGCADKQISVEVMDLKVFYADRNNEKIVTENRKLKINSDDNKYMVAMEELIKGPKDKKLKMNIHPKTVVLGVEKYNDVAIVNFSKEFNDVNGEIQQMIAIMTVTSTLTQFAEIQNVKIMIEGKEYTPPYVMKDNMVGKISIDDKEQMEELSLYFAGSNADQLIRERRTVKVPSDETIEERIIKELIKGPEGTGIHKTIPVNTRLINITVDSDIAIVNFSESFIKDHWGGSTGETMTIYSIVNSLTERPQIKKVKFLINGEDKLAFGHYSFDQIFERDEALILK